MRFQVKQVGEKEYTVIDHLSFRWGGSETAIPIRVSTQEAANTIADILNREWLSAEPRKL